MNCLPICVENIPVYQQRHGRQTKCPDTDKVEGYNDTGNLKIVIDVWS